MTVSCFTVLWKIISKPRNENLFWIYIIKPIIIALIVSLIVSICAGALYLYLVPFTNIVGMGLFADYTCPSSTGVWQVCGRLSTSRGNYNYHFDPNGTDVAVGFFVFLIIQSTIGFAIISIIFYGCSRREGYVKRFTWKDCCNAYCCASAHNLDEWVQPDGSSVPRYSYGSEDCCGGPNMYSQFVTFLFFSILVTTIFTTTWLGRYIAVNSVTQCLPYKDTRIGLYGCVANSNGQYVGGSDCNNCAGVGFGILGIPILIAEILMICMYYFIKNCVTKCKRSYVETKERLRQERQKNNNQEVIQATAVEMADDPEKMFEIGKITL